MAQAFFVIFIHSLLALLLGWLYFSRYAIKRPPIGVFNLWDVAVMMGGILLIPYLYLALPVWLVAALLGLAALSVVYFGFEPILARRYLIWLLILGLGIGNVALLQWSGFYSIPFLTFNNLLQLMIVVGITNLWAQSGMKARDAAILGGALVGYDYLFTTMLPLMDNLFSHLDGLPFAPLVAWPLADGEWAALGLGDLLLATVFPLVMRKGYGRAAGLTAMVLAIAAIVGVMALLMSGLWQASFPVMIALGPLMIIQYAYWRRRRGVERTMYQYRQGEPITVASNPSLPTI